MVVVGIVVVVVVVVVVDVVVEMLTVSLAPPGTVGSVRSSPPPLVGRVSVSPPVLERPLPPDALESPPPPPLHADSTASGVSRSPSQRSWPGRVAEEVRASPLPEKAGDRIRPHRPRRW